MIPAAFDLALLALMVVVLAAGLERACDLDARARARRAPRRSQAGRR